MHLVSIFLLSYLPIPKLKLQSDHTKKCISLVDSFSCWEFVAESFLLFLLKSLEQSKHVSINNSHIRELWTCTISEMLQKHFWHTLVFRFFTTCSLHVLLPLIAIFSSNCQHCFSRATASHSIHKIISSICQTDYRSSKRMTGGFFLNQPSLFLR